MLAGNSGLDFPFPGSFPTAGDERERQVGRIVFMERSEERLAQVYIEDCIYDRIPNYNR